jgi:hypothetical protein
MKLTHKNWHSSNHIITMENEKREDSEVDGNISYGTLEN